MDNTGLTICGRSRIWGQDVSGYFYFSDLCYIVLKVSPDVVDIRIFCCLFVVCIYMFGWLCRATYCSVESTSDAWCFTCYPKREETLEVSLQRVIAYTWYLLYFDAWCITCCWGISARFAGGVRFHTVVFLIQYILHKDKTLNTRERVLVKLSINNHIS